MSATPNRDEERLDLAPEDEQPIGHEGEDVPSMPDQTVPVYPSTTMAHPLPAGADQLDELKDPDR